MASWWCVCVLFLGGAVATPYVYDSDLLENFSEEFNDVDKEVLNTRTDNRYPGACRTWCSCSGQSRSSYCCPTGIPSDSMCASRSTNYYGESNLPVIQPGVAGGRRVVCYGSYCGVEAGGLLFLSRTDDFCASRFCRVLVNPPPAPAPVTPHVNEPLNSCTSHANCGGDDVCCRVGNVCTAIATCARMMQVQGGTTRVRLSHGMCRSDIDCNSFGTNYICCANQCKTRATCSPSIIY